MMARSHFGDITTRNYLLAGFFTAALPISLAFAIYWWAPWGCDASAWLCLFPLALLGVAPIAALCLPFAFFLNRRRNRPFPDGLVAVTSLTGVVSQVLVTAYAFWLLEDYVRRIFFFEALIFPQGFAAGAVTGATFWFSLVLAARREQSS